MAIAKNIFAGIGMVVVFLIVAFTLIFVGVSYALPRNVIVEREIVVNAPPEAVFTQVNSLQAFSEWSPWGDYDPDMQVTYSGPDTGVGNVMEWQSEHPNVGNGRQEIVEVIENEAVRTSLAFDGMGDAEAWWLLAPDGDGTRVTWGLNSNMGMNPIARWIGLFLDEMVGADYERGLAQLQAAVEG